MNTPRALPPGLTKAQLYQAMAATLAPFWPRDLALLDRHPARWQLARRVDDCLLAHRHDPHTSRADYFLLCRHLLRIYHVL